MFLAGHDVEDHLVGGAHGVGTDDGEVADAAVHIVVDNALGARDVAALHGENGTQQGGRYARGIFRAQLGLAPSQIMPVRLAIMFLTA